MKYICGELRQSQLKGGPKVSWDNLSRNPRREPVPSSKGAPPLGWDNPIPTSSLKGPYFAF